MSDERRRKDLREFLMEKRSGLNPRDVDMPAGARRRVPGLRREEIAELAGVSVDWYRYFESGRPITVSSRFVQRLGRALRLDADDQLKLHLLALGELYEARSATEAAVAFIRADRTALNGAIRSITAVRHLAKRVGDASTFEEIAQLAVHAANDALAPSCAASLSLNTDVGDLSGYAVGPRARYWTENSDRVAYDGHAALRRGGAGVGEHLLSVRELGQDTRVRHDLMRFNEQATAYHYECPLEVWHDFNVGLRAGSCLVVPLFEAARFRGIMALGWMESRSMSPLEIGVAESIASIIALAAR